MTAAFQLNLRRSTTPGPVTLQLEASGAVSSADSPDGAVTVALLGRDDLASRAKGLAEAWAHGQRNPEQFSREPIGAVVIERGDASTSVIAPPIGLRQVFWTNGVGHLDLASHPDRLGSFASSKPTLRPDAFFRYVYHHNLPGPASVYEGISKLQGGHALHWNGGEIRATRYWKPRFGELVGSSETESARELHQLLCAAVQESLNGQRSVGAFLSGGLDSSTVAGVAAQLRPGVPTVSMGFDAAGYDEMEYARIASRHFATRPLEYYVTPEDVLGTLPMIAAAFAEPFGNSSAAAAYHCARIAREHGIEQLLAGDGGDEIFGGNERYARQLVFERYGRVPAALRRGFIEPLCNAAGRVTYAFPVGKALSYIEQANDPLPDRLQAYNFLRRHDPAEVFTSDLLERVDVSGPLRSLREEFAVPETDSVMNRMLFLDWKFTLHDNDLVKVNAMCDLAGVEVAYPMLDQRLVDFSLRLPATWKVHRGELRPFYKRAMRDFLPRAIIEKTKHGFGLPFGVWTRSHDGLRRLSEDALGSLAGRGCFRPDFLRQALTLHREGHASYYGELVWILTVLELWLQAHYPDYRLN